ncbi:tetratricopeptide repeat protein, partial [Candidatus Peregrinibacteria bacterium]|nr:tetratricopeptide repeat protein [Candidatus Peregrinibacteria bacterium]
PIHAHGSYRNAARNALSKTVVGESLPTYMHICKAVQEQGSFLFSEITDIVRTNPTEPSLEKFQSNIHPAQRLAEVMEQGSSPHPWHAVVSIVKDDRIIEFKNRIPTSGEVRLFAYYALSRGTKGIFYRWSDEALRNPIYQSEIKKINTEIQTLKPFITYSEPVSLAIASNPKVEASTLQAGYDAIILLLINHDTKSSPDIINSFSYTVKENFTVTVHIPDGSVIASVSEVISKDKALRIKYTQEGDKITIPIQRLDLTDAFIITIRSKGTTTDLRGLFHLPAEGGRMGLSPSSAGLELSLYSTEDPNQLYTYAVQLYEKITNLKWHYTNLPMYDRVIEIANKIISISPDTDLSIKSQKLIIESYDRQAEYIKRDAAFEKYLETVEAKYDEERAEKELTDIANRYFNSGMTLDAISYYHMLIQRYPESHNVTYAHYKIAESHNRMGNPDIAIREYKKALGIEDISPELAREIFFKLIGVLNKEQKFTEALKILSIFEEKFQDNQITPDIKFYKGYINYMQDNLVTAKEELQELIETYPKTTAASQAKSFLDAMKRQKGSTRGY